MKHAALTTFLAGIICVVLGVGRPAPAGAQAATAAAPVATFVIDGDVTQALTVTQADLKAMPRTTVTVDNEESRQISYEGVLVGELLKRAGAPVGRDLSGKAVATYVRASAKDGYQVVFSLAELDPAFTPDDIIVADTIDGKPLFDYQGPFRIVAPHDKRGARSIRMLQRLEVVRLVNTIRGSPIRGNPRRTESRRVGARSPPGQTRSIMTLSARNHLGGTIDEIQWGDVLVHVTVRVGDHIIESVITRRSAEEMALKKGDAVTAVVKATEVMLSKG